MTDTVMERQEQAEDEDQVDRRARYGGTDLFRGVLVLVIAAAVGILLVGQTPSSPRFLADGDEEEVAGAEVDDALDGPSVDFTEESEETDGAMADSTDDTALGADSAGTDPATGSAAMVDEDETAEAESTDIFPDDDADSDDTVADDTTATTVADTDTDTSEPDDDTAGRRPAEITVIVLNHTDRKGIAGAETDKLTDAGYDALPAANAATASGSGIYFNTGYEMEAEVMASTLGLTTAGLVKPMTDSGAPTVASDVDLSSANIIVVLGRDGFLPTS